MANQRTNSLNLNSFTVKALAGLAILILLGVQDWALLQWNSFFFSAAAEALILLTPLLLVPVQSHGFHHHVFLESLLQTLLTFLTQALAFAGAS